MIKYLHNNEIDIDKWDRCINKSVNSLPYANSWFLDLVHDGWGALVEGNYERVMPLTHRKKYGVKYLFQPYFAQQLGVFSTTGLTPAVVNDFIRKIPNEFKFVDIKLNSFNKLESEDYQVNPNKNHVLDLIHEHSRIQEKYSSQTKRNLKKAGKSSLSLLKNDRPESMIELFRENRGKTLHKWGDAEYNKLKHLIYSSIYKGRGVVYGVYTAENEICAGAFFLKSHQRLIFLFSGSNEAARENAAMTFLIDSVIKEYSPSQRVFDFEGSNDVNLARFYRGFGATEIDYPGLQMNRLTFPVKQLFSFYRLLKKQ